MAKAIASKHNQFPSLYRHIRWTFATLTFALFALYWSVIYVAEDRLEIISLHHWLDTVASKYQRDYDDFGAQAGLPDIAEFVSYWSEDGLPKWLSDYQSPGFYEHLLGSEDKHFLIIPHPSGSGLFYIVFQDDADDYLDGYEEQLHRLTFMVGLLTTLLMVFYGIYLVRTIANPLALIQQKIQQMPPGNPLFSIDTGYQESREIEAVLLQSKIDIANFFQREQEFTRFSSHEMRTSIMVIKGSTDILNKVPSELPVVVKAIGRLEHACDDLTILTDAFLLLGRKTIASHQLQDCQLEQLISRLLQDMAPLFRKQEVRYQLQLQNKLPLHAPESFLIVIINNLMKNALDYSTGEIIISLQQRVLSVRNHYTQTPSKSGYGVGLIIVERICERMSWGLTVHDSGGEFLVSIDFVD